MTIHTHLHYDAVVVGARAAGAATAMLLARAGMRVLAVDRSPRGSDTLSTHALMRGGVVQLRRWGLLDRVVAAGTPPVRRTTFRYATDDVTIQIKPSHGIDALYAPRRTVLDPLLVDAATDAGADLRFGITVTGVRRDRRGRVVGVEGRHRTGTAFSASAALVIGADGRRSTVARLVGAPVERAATSASAVVYGYWSDVETDGYEWIFRPDACAGVIPTNHGLACAFAAASPARIGRGGRAVLESVMQAASPSTFERLRAGTAPAGVRAFAGQPGFLRRSWGPGWALVGDAGSWKDPLSAHGLTDALRDAELLARAAIPVVAGDVPDDALGAYQAERDRLTVPMLQVSDTIAAQRWTDDDIGGLLLQLSASMADELDVIAAFDPVAVP